MSHIYRTKSEENKRGGSTNRFLENSLKLVYPYLILHNIKFKSLRAVYNKCNDVSFPAVLHFFQVTLQNCRSTGCPNKHVTWLKSLTCFMNHIVTDSNINTILNIWFSISNFFNPQYGVFLFCTLQLKRWRILLCLDFLN